MDEEFSSSDDDTSSCSSVVSMPVQKRQKVSKGAGAVSTSSCDISVSTQEKEREKISKGYGIAGTSSHNGVVDTQEKREKVLKGVGVVHNSSRNAVVSTQEEKRECVSRGVGVGVVSTQVKKRREVSNEVGIKVSQQLDVLLDAVAKKSIKGKDEPGCSIAEVMQIVEGIPEIVEDDELFMKAADILTDRQNREMFIALKAKNRQIMWLKHKQV